MSTMAFPNPHSPTSRDSPHQGSHISFFPSAFDPQSSTSSFQVNPLSSHPPRTPRTSIVTAPSSSLTAYTPEIYSSTAERGERPLVTDDEDEDGDEADARAGKRRVRKEEVWREILSTSTGRDKTLKLIQYSMRVYVLFHQSLKYSRFGPKNKTSSRWETQLFQRLDSTMSGLSLARKCLILFNWLTPLSMITAPQPLPYASSPNPAEGGKIQRQTPLLHTFLHAPPPMLLDLLNSFSDDIATISRLGLIGRGVGERAGNVADWCWFAGTLVGLVEVGVEQGLVQNLMEEVESRMYSASFGEGGPVNGTDEKELARLKKQCYWLRISRAKLVMDLIFVSYECFKLRRGRKSVMGITGLLSAVLSCMKLYDRHGTGLMKRV